MSRARLTVSIRPVREINREHFWDWLIIVGSAFTVAGAVSVSGGPLWLLSILFAVVCIAWVWIVSVRPRRVGVWFEDGKIEVVNLWKRHVVAPGSVELAVVDGQYLDMAELRTAAGRVVMEAVDPENLWAVADQMARYTGSDISVIDEAIKWRSLDRRIPNRRSIRAWLSRQFRVY